MKKNKILVVGAGGQFGQAINKTFGNDYQLDNLTHRDVDITDFEKLQKKVFALKPGIVINGAAFHNVAVCEKDVSKSYLVNAVGAYNVAKAAQLVKASILYVSTDFVFDGKNKPGYKEDDYPNPLNVYGASKLAGEQLTRIANPNYYIIRTSALFSEYKSGKGYNFVTLMLELAAKGQAIKVVNDQYTCPTYVPDLALQIKKLFEKKMPYGIYHITNQGYCTWYNFAKTIFAIKGIKTKLSAIATKDSGTGVKRPKFSILINKKLKPDLPTWQESLKKYLATNFK